LIDEQSWIYQGSVEELGVPKEIPWPEAEGGVIKSTSASKEKRQISVSPEDGAWRTDARQHI
jgi:hypothetical protein